MRAATTFLAFLVPVTAKLQVDRAPDYTQCGVLGLSHATQRIVHGHDAGQCVWRWQVSLSSATKQFCGGTLIGREWVLTAAHCITMIRSCCGVRSLRIGAGTWKRRDVDENDTSDVDENDTSDVDESDTSVVRGVRKVYTHPLHQINTRFDYDFALLQLDKEVPINRCIGVACLPHSQDRSGTNCSITGWGRLVSSGPTPELLQEASVTLLTNQICEVDYSAINGTITGSMLCASGRSKTGITDACQGDSGGPLVCKETVETSDGMMASERYVLRGVTSMGEGCAEERYPGVYGRVQTVLNWIEDTMDAALLP